MVGGVHLGIPIRLWAMCWLSSISSIMAFWVWSHRFNLTSRRLGLTGLGLVLMTIPVYTAAGLRWLSRRGLPYVVTAKGNAASPDSLRTFRPHLTWLCWVLVLLALGAAGVLHAFPLIIFWASVAAAICATPVAIHLSHRRRPAVVRAPRIVGAAAVVTLLAAGTVAVVVLLAPGGSHMLPPPACCRPRPGRGSAAWRRWGAVGAAQQSTSTAQRAADTVLADNSAGSSAGSGGESGNRQQHASRACEDTHGHGHGDAHADPDGHRHVDTDRDRDAHADADTHGYRHADTDGHGNGHADADTDGHRHAHADRDRDPHRDSHGHGDAHGHTHSHGQRVGRQGTQARQGGQEGQGAPAGRGHPCDRGGDRPGQGRQGRQGRRDHALQAAAGPAAARRRGHYRRWMQAQREHARRLTEDKDAFYLLPVLGNQQGTYAALDALDWENTPVTAATSEISRGRVETPDHPRPARPGRPGLPVRQPGHPPRTLRHDQKEQPLGHA